MAFVADMSEFPLMKIFQEGRRSVVDAKDMAGSLNWALEQNLPFAVAYDASEAGAPDKGANAFLHTLLTERGEEFRTRCAGIGYYFSEGNLLSAIRARQESGEPNVMPFDWEAFDDWDQAVTWARERLPEDVRATAQQDGSPS